MQASTGQRKSVFISYSRADLAQVRPLAMALRRSGIATWMDLDDLQPGQRWKDAIGAALLAADAMVFCISRLSLDSAWTGVEIGRARALAKPVIPVAMESIDGLHLPDSLADLHVHDMSRHPPRHAAALTARGIAGTLCIGLPDWPDAVMGEAVADELHVTMRAPPTCDARADSLDFSRPDLIRIADLLHGASTARRAVLSVDMATDAAQLGLVLGTLCQAFGQSRVTLCVSGPARDSLVTLARLAGVALRCS